MHASRDNKKLHVFRQEHASIISLTQSTYQIRQWHPGRICASFPSTSTRGYCITTLIVALSPAAAARRNAVGIYGFADVQTLEDDRRRQSDSAGEDVRNRADNGHVDEHNCWAKKQMTDGCNDDPLTHYCQACC